jgi:hypothetical protein
MNLALSDPTRSLPAIQRTGVSTKTLTIILISNTSKFNAIFEPLPIID